MSQTQIQPEPTPVALEAGDPAADPRLFRRCLGQYATGVAVVTASSGAQLNGMTINSFASLSLEPALVLWSIARTSRSFAFFSQCQSFAINVLGADQMHLSQLFSSKQEDRFSAAQWQPGMHGSPLLAGCIAHLECTLEQTFEGGDHLVLVGRVTRIARYAGTPLLFSQGQYSIADVHPDLSGEPESAGSLPRPEHNLLSSIFDAHHALSEAFEEHRRAEGVSVAVARVLASLYARPGSASRHWPGNLPGPARCRGCPGRVAAQGHAVARQRRRLAPDRVGRAFPHRHPRPLARLPEGPAGRHLGP